MAKRFTDTNKYKKPFIRNLPGAYKLLWDFLYHDCDNAGIWIVDFEIAQLYIGKDMLISKEKTLELFNDCEQRIIEIDSGKKWFIPSFIEFQYGHLIETNRAHLNVISKLKSLNLIDNQLKIIKDHKGLISPLQGAKEKEKEQYKEKEMEKEKEISEPELIYSEKTDELEERKGIFITKVSTFRNQYSDKTLKDFFEYWSEHNEGGKKMRFEMEKVFDISRRLATWKKNEIKFQNNGNKKQIITDESLAAAWKKEFAKNNG